MDVYEIKDLFKICDIEEFKHMLTKYRNFILINIKSGVCCFCLRRKCAGGLHKSIQKECEDKMITRHLLAKEG